MATLTAILKRLRLLFSLTTFTAVEHDSDGIVEVPLTMPCLSMIDVTITHDVVSIRNRKKLVYKSEWDYYIYRSIGEFLTQSTATKHKIPNKMADNLRRAMQDIELGRDDAPVVLPFDVVQQAAAENRFILIGKPTMPRRQNLRNLVATMPRVWGLECLVRGRVTEGRRFQIFFPSEEAMDTVVRRGPWAYTERMIVLQRWTPLMDMSLLNFIPLWVQCRGIPFQYMNREVIINIARNMGQYIQMDYNEEAGNRFEFVRFRLNWDINHPLKFQRYFQFTLGENTLLKFHYERLRGFCEVCGMMTHDSGRCHLKRDQRMMMLERIIKWQRERASWQPGSSH